MENYKTTWSREEFQAYLLLYCASADFVITEKEREIIKSKLCVEKYVLFSTLLYIVMGWMIMFVWGDLIANISQQSLILLFIGGILYTLGTIFYMWNWFKYHHFIWHIFVLLGSVAHFFAVYLLV